MAAVLTSIRYTTLKAKTLRASHVRPVLLFAAFFIGCGERPEREDAAQPAEQEVVTGFASIPWGTPLAEITARRGEPSERQETGGGVSSVLFSDTISGRAASAIFDVHREHGLVAGSYIVRIEDHTACELLYRQFDQAVRERYPTLGPEESPAQGVEPGYCDDIRAGRGGRMTTWRDPANGSTVQVILAPPAQGIVLLYRSRRSHELAAEQRQQKY